MGWRVFRVPETATILLGGGVSFSLLDDEQRLEFQVGFKVTSSENSLDLTPGELAQDDVPAGGHIFLSCLHSEEKLSGDL